MSHRIHIRNYEGYTGAFTREQSFHAKYKNGSRVAKVRTEKGDTNPIGVTGTILGSISHPEFGVGYFIEWDHQPRLAVFVVEWKLGAPN